MKFERKKSLSRVWFLASTYFYKRNNRIRPCYFCFNDTKSCLLNRFAICAPLLKGEQTTFHKMLYENHQIKKEVWLTLHIFVERTRTNALMCHLYNYNIKNALDRINLKENWTPLRCKPSNHKRPHGCHFRKTKQNAILQNASVLLLEVIFFVCKQSLKSTGEILHSLHLHAHTCACAVDLYTGYCPQHVNSILRKIDARNIPCWRGQLKLTFFSCFICLYTITI